MRWPIALYTSRTKLAGIAEVRFSDYRKEPDLREALAHAVVGIPGIAIPVGYVREQDFSRRPNIAIRDFTPAQIDTLPQAIIGVFGT